MGFYPFVTTLYLASLDTVSGGALVAPAMSVLPRQQQNNHVSFHSDKTVLDTTWVNATLLKQEL
jgi:hypothetical protein